MRDSLLAEINEGGTKSKWKEDQLESSKRRDAPRGKGKRVRCVGFMLQKQSRPLIKSLN